MADRDSSAQWQAAWSVLAALLGTHAVTGLFTETPHHPCWTIPVAGGGAMVCVVIVFIVPTRWRPHVSGLRDRIWPPARRRVNVELKKQEEERQRQQAERVRIEKEQEAERAKQEVARAVEAESVERQLDRLRDLHRRGAALPPNDDHNPTAIAWFTDSMSYLDSILASWTFLTDGRLDFAIPVSTRRMLENLALEISSREIRLKQMKSGSVHHIEPASTKDYEDGHARESRGVWLVRKVINGFDRNDPPVESLFSDRSHWPDGAVVVALRPRTTTGSPHASHRL